LAQCQNKVIGWGIMFIFGMVLHCADTKTWLKSGPVVADLTTTVVHSNKSMINDIINTFTHSL